MSLPWLIAETLANDAADASAETGSTWVGQAGIAAGFALLTFFLLRRSYARLGRRRRRGSDAHLDAQPRPAGEWSGVKQDADARYTRQQVELQELARDVTAQIDTKLIVLQELIAKSDTQIARLEKLLDELAAARQDRETPQG